jgi:hypothetical protein
MEDAGIRDFLFRCRVNSGSVLGICGLVILVCNNSVKDDLIPMGSNWDGVIRSRIDWDYSHIGGSCLNHDEIQVYT